MKGIEVGKEYNVHHPRKGNFRIQVNMVMNTVIIGEITQGKARYMSEPDRGLGEKITLGRSFPGLVLTSVTE